MAYFAVIVAHGAAWDTSRGLREQAGWDEHGLFMDELRDTGFVMLGGPLGVGERVLLAVAAPDESTLRERLRPDPWMLDGHLVVESIEPWTILLDGRAR